MKQFCSVFVVFMVILAVASEKMDEDYTTDCMNEKCPLACIMKKFGIMNEANKFVPEKLEHYISDGPDPLISKDEQNIKEIVQEIGEACKVLSQADECESALEIQSCLIMGAMQHGLLR